MQRMSEMRFALIEADIPVPVYGLNWSPAEIITNQSCASLGDFVRAFISLVGVATVIGMIFMLQRLQQQMSKTICLE